MLIIRGTNCKGTNYKGTWTTNSQLFHCESKAQTVHHHVSLLLNLNAYNSYKILPISILVTVFQVNIDKLVAP